MGGPGAAGTQQPRAPRLTPVSVEDVVQTDVVTAKPDTPIEEAVQRLDAEQVGSVVVVEDEEPVGIVTDRAIALALAETPDLAQRTVEELVSGDLVTATVEMSVFDALSEMSDADIRRLPIVDEDGELVGILTLDDVLALLGTELGHAVDVIQAQSPRM